MSEGVLPIGDEDTSISTSVAAELLGVTPDAVVKMIDSGSLDAIRTGGGKGRYRVSRRQVEGEREIRLARLHAVDASGAEPELRRRIAELESETEQLRLDSARLGAALRSLIESNRAALDTVELLTPSEASIDHQSGADAVPGDE